MDNPDEDAEDDDSLEETRMLLRRFRESRDTGKRNTLQRIQLP